MENLNKTIHIVEDNEMYALGLEQHLKSHFNYKIEISYTGEEFLQKQIDEPFILILDYHLDSISPTAKNAEQLIQEFRNKDWTMPIIVQSNQGEINKAVNVLKKGSCDYIEKDSHAYSKITSTIERIVEMQNIKQTEIQTKSLWQREKSRLLISALIIVSLFTLFTYCL